MLTILVIVITGVAALAMALKLVRGASPSRQLEHRLRMAASQFAPAEFEQGAADVRKEEALSRIPWLDRWLARLDLAARLRGVLEQADVNWTVGTLLIISVFGWIGTACLVYLRTRALLPSLALSAGFVPLPLLYVQRCRAKRFLRFEEQLPEALDMLVSALRVGHSLMTAIGFLGQETREPLCGEFRKCFDEQNYGIDLRTAMLNLAARMPVQDVRIFVTAVLIQKESGGNMAEVLEKVAQTTRERFRLKRQVRVHTAQGRATGWILSVLPVVLGLGLYLVHPEGVSLLWTRPLGRKMLSTGAGMNILGGLMIRKIVRIRV